MPFKKGQVANPNGRSKVSPDIRIIQKLSREFVELRLTHFLKMPLKELKQVLEDEDKQSIDHFMCSIIVMGIVKGDPVRLNFIFDRLIGRTAERLEINKVEPFIIESKLTNKKIELGSKETVEVNKP